MLLYQLQLITTTALAFQGRGVSDVQFHANYLQLAKLQSENHEIKAPIQSDLHVKFEPNLPTKSFLTSEKFISRLATYDKYCEYNTTKTTLSSLQSIKSSALQQVFYDDHYKIIICTVPKAGTTNWQRVLNTLKSNLTLRTDYWQNKNVYNFADRINQIHPNDDEGTNYELFTRLNDREYHNVITVRHPLTRLLSAWRDKFSKSPATAYFEKKYATFINNKYAHESDELDDKHYVTFKAFLRYIANEPERYFDFHWKSFNRFCKPCQIRYDYIVKAETSLDDSEDLFQDMGISGSIKLPGRYSSSLNPTDHFKSIPNELLTQIYAKYEMDFLLFDYSIDDFLN